MIYSILFHVLWLFLLEIIFYFEYVGPLETTIFKDKFNDIFSDYENDYNNKFMIIDLYNPKLNITVNNDDIISNNELAKAKSDRNKYNNKLYNKSLFIWFMVFFIVVLFSILNIYYDYIKFKKKKELMERIESDSSLELGSINRNLTYNQVNNSNYIVNNTEINLSNEENNFFDYNEIKNIILKKSFYYFLLGGLIILFEYLFFNNIVVKYKVLSNKEIKYLIFKSINPLLNNIFSNNN